jgi:TolB-like protein/tetratricopeptide (TPR) repeat protein
VRVLAELRRRNVFRAATLYAAAAWLVVQVATQVLPLFGAPNWTLRVIVLAAVIGFPFVLAVSWYYELTPEGLKRESEVPREESIRHITGKRLDRAIIAVLSVAVVLLLANTLVRHRDVASVPDKSVAVLPLLDEGSGGGGDRYFSDGLSEELISELTRIEGLKVIGRNSSFQFRGDTSDSKTIGAKLGVATLLEGTVRRDGGRLRIVVELINAANGSSLWSQVYDRELKDIFDVQSDIARSVAAAMKIKLQGDAGAGDRPPGGSVDAYNAYLQGRFYGERGTESDERRAIAWFNEATRIDPRYARAYAELSSSWTNLTSAFLGGAETQRGYASARVAAGLALKLAPDLASAHTANGYLLYSANFDWKGAEAEYRRALELMPGYEKAKSRLGTLLATLGQTAEAVELTRESLEIDPLHAISYSSLANYLSALGRLDEAEQAIDKAIELQPSAQYYYTELAIIRIQRGDAPGALQAAQAEPAGNWRDIALALARQIGGDPALADAALQNVIVKYADDGAWQIAQIYALRKQPDEAFAWLERARANNDPGISNLLTDPFLLAYRDDPRFAAFCRRVGLPAAHG